MDKSIDLNSDPIEQQQEEGVPTIGMSFPSCAEYAKFVIDYARRLGFSLFRRGNRLEDSYREAGVTRKGVKDKEPQYHMMTLLRYKCSKGGRKQSEGSTVTGCKFFVYGRQIDDQFVITQCQLQHNHPMDPSYSRFMPNYKYIDDSTFDVMVRNDNAGISIKKNFNSFSVANEGRHNLTFDEQDLRNTVNVYRRCTLLQGDAAAMEKYFENMAKHDDRFFFRMKKNDENRVICVFWADARSRESFKEFGDINSFDTTFLCNRYKMPFAPFVGVNHHGSSILLGAALITQEDTDTFVWVFQQWLECMGQPPKGILTDQDKAICKAISIVFPDVAHRLCIWLIIQNAARNLGSHSRWQEIDKTLHDVVHDSLTPEEFDEAWAAMIEKYRLGNNTWLKETFDIKEQWAPGYWKSSFWAGMSSTQRSEGMNRFFKTYVSSNTGLTKFAEQYKMALLGKVEEETKNNHKCLNSPLPCDDSIFVASIFHKAYTNAKYKEVYDEIIGLRHTNAVKVDGDDVVMVYKVDEKIPKPVWKATKKTFEVTLDKQSCEFSCSCKMFEFRGILCKHIIRVLELEDVATIPEKYILRRWRKDVYRSYEGVKVDYYDSNESTRVKNANEVAQRSAYLTRLALSNDDTLAIYKESTDKLRDSLEAALGITRTGFSENWFDQSVSSVYGVRRIRPKHCNQRYIKRSVVREEGATKDPVDNAGNGRKHSTRLKHPAEKGRGGGNKARRQRTKVQEQEALELADMEGRIEDVGQIQVDIDGVPEMNAPLPYPNKRQRLNIQIPKPLRRHLRNADEPHICSQGGTDDVDLHFGLNIGSSQEVSSHASPTPSSQPGSSWSDYLMRN